ncbi:MAG: AAA family ATPase [Succinivibrio sp.]|nr:AAA family ATPase [Succinivibrio sp.]
MQAVFIKRALTSLLENALKHRRCIFITGPLGAGKTSLLKTLYPKESFVNLDCCFVRLDAFDSATDLLNKYQGSFVIDEIQKSKPVLNKLKDKFNKERQVLVFTSSNTCIFENSEKKNLLPEHIHLELSGLSLRELYKVDFNAPFLPTEDYLSTREQELISYNDVWGHIFKGNYPALYQSNDLSDSKVQEYYSEYFAHYVEGLYSVHRDCIKFAKFVAVVASCTNCKLNLSKLSREAEISLAKVKKWLSLLLHTGLIYLVKPYDYQKQKRLSCKIYFRDTGLACYATQHITCETTKLSLYASNLFKTFVVNEMIKSYLNAGDSFEDTLFYYPVEDSLIDVVLEKENTVYPVAIHKNKLLPKELITEFNHFKGERNTKLKRGLWVVLGLFEKKTYLKDNLVALPISYI